MFKKKRELLLTNEIYARWLRAMRPPFTWFLEQSEEDQEQMALLGDEYLADLCVAVGFAVADPVLADLSLKDDGQNLEEAVLSKLVQNIASRISKKNNGTIKDIFSRSKKDISVDINTVKYGDSFLGKKPKENK